MADNQSFQNNQLSIIILQKRIIKIIKTDYKTDLSVWLSLNFQNFTDKGGWDKKTKNILIKFSLSSSQKNIKVTLLLHADWLFKS